ncbi:myosin heavy chain, clone, putative [Entamoeba dispar SAW760]|uniref:Myosin heavy chain, clone, putative n=1 Tax=Entamoeba dispar (strain ATCC PRA-260 / SAW760) TaxID=370354 RepID=B0EBF9_ENTDS|nr:myosin heavy chain, clone, putative [Entamoeba dispar SAW760]EDR28140.1 myosin heavy chain, clone, putative [Entamoeba dispar SAW760]|eukprot:EDR28140.1 myosin heavy chain, clone, putative [Entamoeba dispar SAW760]
MTEQHRSRFSVKKQEAVRKHREETVDSVIDTYAQLIENIDQKNEENKIKQPNKKRDNEKIEKKKLSVDPKRIDSIFDKLEEVNDNNNEPNTENELTPHDFETNIAMSYLQNEYDVDINHPQLELTKSKIEPNTFKTSLKRFSYCPVLFSNNDENIKEIKEEFQVGVDNILDSYIDINDNQPHQEEKESQQNPTLTAPSIPSQDFAEEENLYNRVETPYLTEDNKTTKNKSFEEMINHYPIELPNESKSLIHSDDKSDNTEKTKLVLNPSVIKTKEELTNKKDSKNNTELEPNEKQESKMVDIIVNWHPKKPNNVFQTEWEQEKYNLKSYNLEDTINDKTVDENELSKLELKRFNTQPIDVSSIISPKKSDGTINNTQEMIEDELDKKHIEKLTEETKRLTTTTSNEKEEDFTKYLIKYQGKPSIFQGRKGNEDISEVKEEFQVGIDNILDSYIDLNNNTTQQEEEKLEELNNLDLQKSSSDKEEIEKLISQEEENEKDKTSKENDSLQKSSVIDLHLLGNGTPLFIKVNLNIDLKENIEEQEKKRTLLQLTTNQMKKAVVEKLKKESIKKLENSGLDNEEINKKVNLCVQVAEKEWDDAVVKLGQKTAIFSSVKKN